MSLQLRAFSLQGKSKQKNFAQGRSLGMCLSWSLLLQTVCERSTSGFTCKRKSIRVTGEQVVQVGQRTECTGINVSLNADTWNTVTRAKLSKSRASNQTASPAPRLYFTPPLPQMFSLGKFKTNQAEYPVRNPGSARATGQRSRSSYHSALWSPVPLQLLFLIQTRSDNSSYSSFSSG